MMDKKLMEFSGRTFEVRIYADDDNDAPWDREDGHGPVRAADRRHNSGFEHTDKKPGERPLNHATRGETQYFYDWAEAMRIARRDGWGLSDADRATLAKVLGREPTKREVHATAVARDFQRMRDFLAGNWCYVGVTVCMMDDAGELMTDDAFTQALWGIESDGNYWEEVARELAGQCIAALAEEDAKLIKAACKSVIGGWQTLLTFPDKSEALVGPVFNSATDLWQWQETNLHGLRRIK